MWRILLLFVLFFTIDLSAKAQSVDSQLEKINQQDDKTIAVAQLGELLKNEAISHSQRIKILILQTRGYLSLSDLNKALSVIQQAKELADRNNLPIQQAQVDKLFFIFKVNMIKLCFLTKRHYIILKNNRILQI